MQPRFALQIPVAEPVRARHFTDQVMTDAEHDLAEAGSGCKTMARVNVLSGTE